MDSVARRLHTLGVVFALLAAILILVAWYAAGSGELVFYVVSRLAVFSAACGLGFLGSWLLCRGGASSER